MVRALPRLSGERHNVCEGRDGEGDIRRKGEGEIGRVWEKEKGRGRERESE